MLTVPAYLAPTVRIAVVIGNSDNRSCSAHQAGANVVVNPVSFTGPAGKHEPWRAYCRISHRFGDDSMANLRLREREATEDEVGRPSERRIRWPRCSSLSRQEDPCPWDTGPPRIERGDMILDNRAEAA